MNNTILFLIYGVGSVILIVMGYFYDKELREKYHKSAPEAFIISGSLVAFLLFIKSLTYTRLKNMDDSWFYRYQLRMFFF
jgi:hypothetical protein